MLYFPERIAKGDVPNVDFLHLYGPGSLHVLVGWYELFGNTLAAERTFGLIQHVAIIFGLFALARPWGRVAATLVACFAVFYVLTPIGLTAMAWNGGLALTLWCAVFAVRSTFLVGRPRCSLALVAGVPRRAGADVPPRPRPRRRRRAGLADLDPARRRGAPWLIGVVVGLTPLWVHLAVAGPRAAWQGMVVDPVVHLRAGRELPRPPSWDRLDGALQAIAESQPPWWQLPHVARLAGDLPVVLRDARRHRRPARPGDAGTAPRTARRPGDGAPRRRPRERRHPAPGAAAARLDPPHVGDVRVLAVRRRRRRRHRPAAVAAGDDAPRASSRAPPSRWCSRTSLTSLFTFRHYLLHTRVGFGLVPPTLRDQPRRAQLLLRRPAAALASQQVIDDLDGLARSGDRLFVGPAGPVPHVVQRRRLLLDVPGDGAGDVLHRDGSRPRQRRGLAPRRRPRQRRLRHPHLVLERLARTERLDGLRVTRPERGPRRQLLPVPRRTRTASSASTTAAADPSPFECLGTSECFVRNVQHETLRSAQTLGWVTTGTRRQRGAGRWRAMAISGRIAAGTQTIRRPARSALTVAVGHRFGGGRQRLRFASLPSSSSAPSRGGR